jgi:hypothetical protein
MAQRAGGKRSALASAPAPRPARKAASARAVVSKSSEAADPSRVAALEAELVAARARIVELEARQAEIADRIAWALDSLHDFRSGER